MSARSATQANGCEYPPVSADARATCSQCNLREFCLPVGLSPQEMYAVEDVVTTRRVVEKGEALYRDGDPFTSIYAIRLGNFKTCVNTLDGRDQVTGFHMTGELLGMDGIGTNRHACNAIALERAEVCVMPYGQLSTISTEVPALQRHFHRIMSREIVREHGVMLLLGSMRAEERLAAFVLNLVQRLSARGFSKSELVLRMTREEIGSYLGLKLETVSRTFSKSAEEGIVEVKQRHLRMLDTEALKRIVNGQQCHN